MTATDECLPLVCSVYHFASKHVRVDTCMNRFSTPGCSGLEGWSTQISTESAIPGGNSGSWYENCVTSPDFDGQTSDCIAGSLDGSTLRYVWRGTVSYSFGTGMQKPTRISHLGKTNHRALSRVYGSQRKDMLTPLLVAILWEESSCCNTDLCCSRNDLVRSL